MIIRPSSLHDLKVIMDIFEHARRFMQANGNPNQWTDGYPSIDLIRQEIERGDSYVCQGDDGEVAGVFSFIAGEDPTYARIEDGAWLNDDSYHVIHRMATNGRQKGVADACFRWCFEHSHNIRVDTHHDNRIMQHILEKHGFRRCGIIYTRNDTPRIAYQRTISEKALSLPPG